MCSINNDHYGLDFSEMEHIGSAFFVGEMQSQFKACSQCTAVSTMLDLFGMQSYDHTLIQYVALIAYKKSTANLVNCG